MEDFEAGEKSSLRGGVSQTSPLLEQGGLAGLTLAVGGEVACKLAGVLPEGGGSQGELGDLRLMEAGVEDVLTGEVEFQEWRDMLTGVTLPVGEDGDCWVGGENKLETRGPGRGVNRFG